MLSATRGGNFGLLFYTCRLAAAHAFLLAARYTLHVSVAHGNGGSAMGCAAGDMC